MTIALDEDDWFDRHPWMYALTPALPGLVMLALGIVWFWWCV